MARIFNPNSPSGTNRPASGPAAMNTGPSEPARGGSPMMPTSTNGAPAFVTVLPILILVGGLTALQST